MTVISSWSNNTSSWTVLRKIASIHNNENRNLFDVALGNISGGNVVPKGHIISQIPLPEENTCVVMKKIENLLDHLAKWGNAVFIHEQIKVKSQKEGLSSVGAQFRKLQAKPLLWPHIQPKSPHILILCKKGTAPTSYYSMEKGWRSHILCKKDELPRRQ